MKAAKSPLQDEYSVAVKYSAGTYVARAHGTTASCTSGEQQAVERLAVKLWGEGEHQLVPQRSGTWCLTRGAKPQKVEYSDLVAAAALMEEHLNNYLFDYEFDDGDGGCHMPTEIEALLIDDAVHGLLADKGFMDALVAWYLLVGQRAWRGPIEPQLLTALRHARTWIEDAQEQLAKGDRVDTADSLRLALPPVVAAIEQAEARHGH